MKYWLMKTEPDVFSFDDLLKCPKKTTCWEGVRNYQARNFLRDECKKGDLVLIYHSNTQTPGIVGIAKVVKEAYPDPSANDPKSPYYDDKPAKDGSTRWFMIDVQAVKKLPKIISLSQIKSHPQLKTMLVAQKGQRLSVQPVKKSEYDLLQGMATLYRDIPFGIL